MRTRSISTCSALLLSVLVSATHIIGGEMYYEHVSGDDHLVTLRLYRDCGPGNTNGTGFDASVEIGVFDGSGNYLFSEFLNLPGSNSVPVVLNNPCLSAPPTICVEEAEYSGVFDLPSIPGGYTLAFQRCCRTPTIVNISIPNNEGLTCAITIPEANVHGVNSSPQFTAYPPVALCIGQAMVFDHGAVDPDGDLLVYELCTPYNGGGPGNPAPSPPAGPAFTFVPWAAGYSQAYQMDANPALAIDPQTGELTVTPTLIGSYVVGICVKEFRNGVLLGEVRRDLRFDAVPCQVNIISSIQQQQVFCAGFDVQMQNLSTGGTFYHWDFGEPNTMADTSDLVAPIHTYADTGSYTVTLVVNPGWPCADTSYATFEIHPPIEPEFVRPPIQCVMGTPVPLQALGNFTANAQVDWVLGSFANTGTGQGVSIGVSYSQVGEHPVELIVQDHGCTESYIDTIVVYPRPESFFTTDTAGCTPLEVRFDNLSTAWTALHYIWDLGNGQTSTLANPDNIYVDPGFYDIRLTVHTDSGCIDTATFIRSNSIVAWTPPTAFAYSADGILSVFDPVVTVEDGSIGATSWLYTVDGATYATPSFTHTFSDAGYYTVVQEVVSGLGCSDTMSFVVHVADHLFHVPNAFTPDGNGNNDVFLPVIIGAREYSMTIHDRWGVPIFSTTDPKQGWDGGNAIQGVYVYSIWFSEYSAVREQFTGTVTLLR